MGDNTLIAVHLILAFLLIVLFAGEPDLQDAIIQSLMKGTNP